MGRCFLLLTYFKHGAGKTGLEREAPTDHTLKSESEIYTGGKFILQSVVLQIHFHHCVHPRAGPTFSQ